MNACADRPLTPIVAVAFFLEALRSHFVALPSLVEPHSQKGDS
jgi:hypothetical protein